VCVRWWWFLLRWLWFRLCPGGTCCSLGCGGRVALALRCVGLALRGVALALRGALKGLLCVNAENLCVSDAEYSWVTLNELCER